MLRPLRLPLTLLFMVGGQLGLGADCFDDLGCSLNGECWTAGSPYTCHCDPGWIGTHCDILDLQPVERNTGYNHTSYVSPDFYRQNGNSSWCGDILQDPTDPKLYHLFTSQMSYGCGLAGWRPFSTIVRAESRRGPRGPYEWKQEVQGGFHHNPTVKWSPADGKALLFFIGKDVELPKTCSSQKWANTVSVSASEDLENWTEPQALLENMTNPAPWPLHSAENETSAVLLAVEKNNIFYADGWEGPYRQVASPGFLNRTEDPFLWRDKRGNWHLLMHNMIDIEEFAGRKYPRVGAHAFARSFEGPWFFSDAVTFTSMVKFTDETSVDLNRRERPKLWFSTDGDMVPLYLVNGVQEMNSSKSYTMIQPIGDKWMDYERGLGFDAVG